MTEIPKTLEAAIAQSREATQAAIADGLTRLQVELVFPELKPMPVAQQFIEVFADLGSHIKVYFPDAGAAALARRDWGELPFEVRGIGEIKGKMQPDDQAFILVAPSSVEVVEVEKICEEAGDRPLIMLNPCLEDISTIGIGYAGRQLRERFLSTFETCYYLRPLEQAALLRCYPSPWQVWLENQDDYQLIAEVAQKPVGEDLDRLLAKETSENTDQPTTPPKTGFFKDLQRLLKALGQ
ncbi:MAG: DUF1995 family protein [Leptolyngbyaceae bacterium]|nr:DUF1995 family protein [Leptolyngbyaceae bacterium]